jgi:hypothetical protein
VKEKSLLIYYLFFSYILVYPFAFPFLLIFGFTVDDLSTSLSSAYIREYTFWAIVSIIGSLVLNAIFEKITKMEKCTIYSWFIFILHLVLIPFTPYVILSLSFYI